MKKKILFALLICAALSLSLSACANNEDLDTSGTGSHKNSKTSSDLPEPEKPTVPAADEADFEVSDTDGGVEIKYIGAGGDVVIPSKIGEKAVTALASYAFKDCENLGHITIPSGVTVIGHAAFWNSNVKSVTIPDSVTEIESLAFKGCDDLKSIKLPKNVTVIGDDMFKECAVLESVTLPEGLTEIGTNAFSGCESLEELKLPDSMTVIDASAFWNCRKIKVSYKGKTYDYANIDDLYKAINGQ